METYTGSGRRPQSQSISTISNLSLQSHSNDSVIGAYGQEISYETTGDSKAQLFNNHVETDKAGWGVRHIFTIMGYMGLAISYMNRNNLSIAIVAMAGSNVTAEDNSTEVCPVPATDNSTIDESQTGEFHWDESTQGILLGTFFYGYICGNLLGGFLADYLGGRLVLGLGVLTTSIFSMLSPLCARTSVELFVAVRVLSGLSQGPLYPALFSLMTRWIPPNERAGVGSVMLTGNHMGTIISMSLGGIMASSNFLGGWPAIFYVFGFVGLIWTVGWFLLVRDQPEQHPFISTKELNYLKNTTPVITSAKNIKIPWLTVLTSPVFLCLIVYNISDGIGFFTLITETPTYLSNIQNFDLASNGLISALPYVCISLFAPVYGYFMNFLSSNGHLTIKTIRKFSTAMALFGPAASLVGLCFANCNSTMAIVFLCFSVGLTGAKYCGANINEQDIAPSFAGALKGITNTAGCIPGVVAPMMTGAIISGNQTLSAWREVFLISAGFYVVGAIGFLVFGTDKEQPWAKQKGEKEIDKY